MGLIYCAAKIPALAKFEPEYLKYSFTYVGSLSNGFLNAIKVLVPLELGIGLVSLLHRALPAEKPITYKGGFIAALLMLLPKFTYEPCVVTGPSMLPNIGSVHVGYVERWPVVFGNYKARRFDLVKIDLNREKRKGKFLKRVVGMPREFIKDAQEGIYVDGKLLELPFEFICEENSGYQTQALKSGEYWVFADNRPDGADSRHWGPVRHGEIQGKFKPLFRIL